MPGVLLRRSQDDTSKRARRSCANGWGDWSEAATSQGLRGTAHDCWQPPEAGERQGADAPSRPPDHPALPTPRLRPGLQDSERVICDAGAHAHPPARGPLLQPAQGAAALLARGNRLCPFTRVPPSCPVSLTVLSTFRSTVAFVHRLFPTSCHSEVRENAAPGPGQALRQQVASGSPGCPRHCHAISFLTKAVERWRSAGWPGAGIAGPRPAGPQQ